MVGQIDLSHVVELVLMLLHICECMGIQTIYALIYRCLNDIKTRLSSFHKLATCSLGEFHTLSCLGHTTFLVLCPVLKSMVKEHVVSTHFQEHSLRCKQ